MSQTWLASDRFGLAMAPGGAALVQDFLNTKAIASYPDLLADPELAQTWTTSAITSWAHTRDTDVHPPALSTADIGRLRTLRDTIANVMAGDAAAGDESGAVSASFALSDVGKVRLEPTGRGWRWLASALWGEILLSQHTGTWRRLKQCHNAECGSTFYDRSKNNSGVWHNVKVCGNAANLRASRARRRERSIAADRPTDIASPDM